MKNVIETVITETQLMNPAVPLAANANESVENRLSINLDFHGVTSPIILPESILLMSESQANFIVNISDNETIVLSHEYLSEYAKLNQTLDLSTKVLKNNAYMGFQAISIDMKENLFDRIPVLMEFNIGKENCGRAVYAFGKNNGQITPVGAYVADQEGKIRYRVSQIDDQILLY